MSDSVGIYVNFVAPLVTLYHVIVVGVATGAISMFITQSALLTSFHEWLKTRSPFLEELLSCPWCTSHWVGAGLLLVYQPGILDGWRPGWMYPVNFLFVPVDFLVTLMVVVTVAAVTSKTISSAYSH
jgi:hypothetical protein